MAEQIDLEEYKVDRGPGGERLTHEHELQGFDVTVEFVKPNWGEKAQFQNDFGSGNPQANQVDSSKILKFFKMTFENPDFSRYTVEMLEDLDGDFVQKLLDVIGNLYNHPDNRTMDLGIDMDIDPDSEAGQKKSNNSDEN